MLEISVMLGVNSKITSRLLSGWIKIPAVLGMTEITTWKMMETQ